MPALTFSIVGVGSLLAPAAPAALAAPTPVAAQVITFAQPDDRPFSAGPLTVAPTATSGLPVTLTGATGAVCTVSGLTITPVKAGTCTVHADQPGGGQWTAAPRVTRSFEIAKIAQIVGSSSLPSVLVTAGPVTLTASPSSGLPATFTGTTPTVCAVSGSTATPLSPGNCGFDIDVPGNDIYLPAHTERGFTVLREPTAIVIPPNVPANVEHMIVVFPDTAVPGQTITVNGAGYGAEVPITFALYPGAIPLGTTVTDGGGAFSTPVTLPTGLSPGSYTLLAGGLSAINTPRFSADALTVNSPAGLPITGPTTNGSVTVGTLSILIGIALLLLGRRRHTRR